ncbi:MAG: hypothetical protein H0V66_10485 [Bdellovibrionales bacterium]|nr:hypothetical protein [Bdellovibrionales bacterium]
MDDNRKHEIYLQNFKESVLGMETNPLAEGAYRFQGPIDVTYADYEFKYGMKSYNSKYQMDLKFAVKENRINGSARVYDKFKEVTCKFKVAGELKDNLLHLKNIEDSPCDADFNFLGLSYVLGPKKEMLRGLAVTCKDFSRLCEDRSYYLELAQAEN